METLDLRIAKLERRLKTYQYIFIAIAATGFFFITSAFTGDNLVPAKLQAKSFEVVDEQGNVLVSLGAYEGKGIMTTYNEAGQMLADIISNSEGSGGITLFDGKGNRNLELTNTTGGGGFVRIKNPVGGTVLTLGRTTANDGCLMLYNASGKNVIEITSDVNGDGVVITQSNNGTGTARIPQ